MFDSPIIDIALSFALIYFVFSLVSSGVLEIINNILRRRSEFLKEVIFKVFNDTHNKNWGALVYLHPLIENLKENEKRLPSYIPSGIFAEALIEVVIAEGKETQYDSDESGNLVLQSNFRTKNTLEDYKAGLKNIKNQSNSNVTELLETFLRDAGSKDDLHTKIASWYDDYMDRIIGWYKRRIQPTLFWISLVIALAFNVDSIDLAQKLIYDIPLREALVERAMDMSSRQDLVENNNTDSLRMIVKEFTESSSIPIGWEMDRLLRDQEKIEDRFKKEEWKWLGTILFWFFKILGIVITGFALSMQAPFWFNVLNRLVNIKSSGNTPQKIIVKTESSKD